MSAWYPRSKLSLRITIIYLGSSVAGAFGGMQFIQFIFNMYLTLTLGIFAYALSLMDGVGGLEGWRWIL